MGIKAKQVMIPIDEYPIVFENDSVENAAKILIEQYQMKDSSWQGYESLLVVNTMNEKVGFLTLRCILKAMELNDTGTVYHNLWQLFADKIKIATALYVKNLMRPLHISYVKLHDDIDQAIEILMKNSTNSVFVRDKGDIVGIIRVIDILWFLEDLI